MHSTFFLAATLLCTSFALAQTGTNNAQSQQMTKPRTGNAANIATSPDVNSAATGTRGNTLGTSGDVSSNGTNGADSPQMTKPRTGRAADIITSPDVNSAITGTRGSTLGTPGDISSQRDASVAGANSAAAQSTAEVSTREQMERDSLRARLGQSGAEAQTKNTTASSKRSAHRNATNRLNKENRPQQ